MPDIERRFTPNAKATIETRADEDGTNHIVGYAAVYYDGTRDTEYELWDGAVERIMPGAFDEPLKNNDDVVALFNHDSNMLLGRRSADTLGLSSDKKGLPYDIVRGNTTVGNDVAEHVARGDLTGSSFAFRVTDERWIDDGDREIREVNGVELFDVGPVTYPAYKGTTTGVRGGDCHEARTSHKAWKDSQKPTNNPDLLLLDIEIESLR